MPNKTEKTQWLKTRTIASSKMSIDMNETIAILELDSHSCRIAMRNGDRYDIKEKYEDLTKWTKK